MENVDFFVVQTPSDIPNIHGSGTGTPVTGQSSAASTPTANLAPGQIAMTGRQTTVVGIFHMSYILDTKRNAY